VTPPRPTARPATATPTPTPASRGWLNASATTIDVGGSTTVRASWEPPGLATWLGFASDSTAVLGRSSRCSGTRFVEPPSEASLRVYGCQGGSGTVELRAGSITGRLLDSITITVRTPTPTPTPVTPSGELSATKTSIVVGDEVTVSAVNVVPSGQSVYIVTNGRLGFAGPGTCHFEINPRSSGKSARSWTLEGCSPPGSGSVTLKTSHNGQPLVLDTITIDVSPAPTPTPTPNTPLPTATPPAVSDLVATASTTSVRLSWEELDGAAKYRVQHRVATSTGAYTRVETTGIAHRVSGLHPGTSYAFKVQAYGNGTRYTAAWGAEAATTVSTVALAKPPAPGKPSASASGEDSVSVSWTALTGADEYAVRYRQGSSGTWATDEDDITGTSHPVDDLDCDTGYQFSVRAYGDGVNFLSDWGAWSSASDEVRTSTCPTPTATPTPSNPTGSIGASPATIAVEQGTTLTVDWSNVPQTPTLVVGNTSVLDADCGTSRAITLGSSPATVTLEGCSSGTTTVTLKNGATTLDAITVTVVAKPNIVVTRRIGYRWFNIGWTAARPYTSFAIEWRNEGQGRSAWKQLPTTGQSGPRAIMSGMAAAIRGLEHEDDRDVEVVVVASDASGLEGRSEVLRYARYGRPPARGHLPDHTMRYRDTISSSGVNATLAGWIKPQLWSAASAWADLVPELDLEACSTTCARNEDKEIFWIEIDADCNHRAACVKGLPAFNLGLELEGRIVGSGLRMVFAPDTAALVAHKWTDDPTKDREEVGDGRLYRWIDRVVVHEFGHTFGLADRDPDGTHPAPNYRGIMNRLTGDKGIKPDDRAALWAIYGTHTRNHGW
jgi:hypothetical protein